MKSWLQQFLLPKPTRRFGFRVVLVGVGALVLFGLVFKPGWIRGRSMEPTYHDGALVFCWRQRYWLRDPRPGDVVMVRYAGEKVMMLKRVIAGPGQTVEFRDGQVLIDGNPLSEPYVKGTCNWHLRPFTVAPGHLYVVGDNRSMPLEDHLFGQVARERIAGGPLW